MDKINISMLGRHKYHGIIFTFASDLIFIKRMCSHYEKASRRHNICIYETKEENLLAAEDLCRDSQHVPLFCLYDMLKALVKHSKISRTIIKKSYSFSTTFSSLIAFLMYLINYSLFCANMSRR